MKRSLTKAEVQSSMAKQQERERERKRQSEREREREVGLPAVSDSHELSRIDHVHDLA
jgi:hypothetical protein